MDPFKLLPTVVAPGWGLNPPYFDLLIPTTAPSPIANKLQPLILTLLNTLSPNELRIVGLQPKF